MTLFVVEHRWCCWIEQQHQQQRQQQKQNRTTNNGNRTHNRTETTTTNLRTKTGTGDAQPSFSSAASSLLQLQFIKICGQISRRLSGRGPIMADWGRNFGENPKSMTDESATTNHLIAIFAVWTVECGVTVDQSEVKATIGRPSDWCGRAHDRAIRTHTHREPIKQEAIGPYS